MVFKKQKSYPDFFSNSIWQVPFMGKTLDYLLWRGDLSFSQDSFNDIDALILALLSYLPLKDIVPGPDSQEAISLNETSSIFFKKHPIQDGHDANINSTAMSSFDNGLVKLLDQAARCARFKNVLLSKFEENTDFVVGRQFAGLTYTLNNRKREKVIAFRGTDNSIIGWKEDFELSYMEQTPAQESAGKYLSNSINIFSGPITVCGHSKGGNLAIFAGSHLSPIQQWKISKIINFDGPGFDFSITNRSTFEACENKIFNYIPEDSMVGLLLESVGKRTVVASATRYINQHNAFNWNVIQKQFIEGNLSSEALLLEQTLKTWLKEISISERETFLEALFDILGASEGAMIKFNPEENIHEIKNILVKYAKLDNTTKELLTQIFNALTNQTKKTISTTIMEKIQKLIPATESHSENTQ
jgi:hypothetical protein